MADVLLTRRAVILAKTEDTYGTTTGSLDASNAILTTQPEISFETEMYERDVTRQSLSPLPPRPTNIDVNISFSCEIKGTTEGKYYNSTGTSQIYPEVDPLLLACGMTTTDLSDEADDRIYLLDTDMGVDGSNNGHGASPAGYKSCTIHVYWSGHLYKITGCIGTFSVSMEQGGIGLYNFEMKGQFNQSAANWDMNKAVIDSPSYETILPPLCAGSTLTMSGIDQAGSATTDAGTLSANTLEFALNNEVSALRTFSNANATTEKFYISARKPTGSFNPLVEKGATEVADFFRMYKEATEVELKAALGTENANQVVFSFSQGSDSDTNKTVFTELGFEDENGARRYNVGFQMNGSFAGEDDEFKIAYKKTAE